MSFGRPVTFARAGVGRALHQFLARYPRALSERLLQHAGIGPKQLANPDELLSLPSVIEALEVGAHESNDSSFGLSFGEAAPFSEFGPLGDGDLHVADTPRRSSERLSLLRGPAERLHVRPSRSMADP